MIRNLRLLILSLLSFPLFSQQVSTLVPGPSTFNDGLAIDRYGNIFASRYFSSTVTKITPDGQTSIFANGMSDPNGLVFDARGRLWVPEATGNKISVFDTAGNLDSTVSIPNPAALIWDKDSNLIIADYTNNVVSIMDSAGNISPYWTDQSQLNGPIGLAFDSADNFYMGNFTDGRIFKRTPQDSVIQIADLPGNMGFMTLAGNNLYATAFTVHKIYRIPLDGSGEVVFSGLNGGYVDGHVSLARYNQPNGITSTKTGDTLYISEYNPRRLRMITGVLNPMPLGLGAAASSGFSIYAYPNPVLDQFQIEMDLERSGSLNLELFSRDGRKVYHESHGHITKGLHTFSLQRNQVDHGQVPGIYLLKVTLDREIITKKLIFE